MMMMRKFVIFHVDVDLFVLDTMNRREAHGRERFVNILVHLEVPIAQEKRPGRRAAENEDNKRRYRDL